MPESPFEFRHSGTGVKALTYGNLGTGGLSKAAFEQTCRTPPERRFIPGFGTHFVEHRAIDPAGNIGPPRTSRPRCCRVRVPACTTTLTGAQTNVTVATGVTCLDGATVSGNVVARSGASVVVNDGQIGGTLDASGRRHRPAVRHEGPRFDLRRRLDGQHHAGKQRPARRRDPVRQRRDVARRRAGGEHDLRRSDVLERSRQRLRRPEHARRPAVLRRLADRAGAGLDARDGRCRRDGPGDALAHARRPGHVRRLHPGRRARVHGDDDRERDLNRRRRDAVGARPEHGRDTDGWSTARSRCHSRSRASAWSRRGRLRSPTTR